MIVRKLVQVYNEDYGHGWLPLHRKDDPDLSPASGYGIAHDLLEHEVDKIGGAEGEFMALGALCWIREESGWFVGRTFRATLPVRLCGDIADILSKIAQGEQTLKDPGRSYKLRDWDHYNEMMNLIAAFGVNALKENEAGHVGALEDIPYPVEEIKRRMVGWMRKGFRKAIAFYYTRHRLDSSDMSYIFDKVIKLADEKQKYAEEGDILTVRIDPVTHNVSGTLSEYSISQW